MNYSRFSLALLCLPVFASTVLHAQAPQLTVDQVIAKHFEAEGGLAKHKAITTLRMTAHLAGSPVEMKFITENKRPASLRNDQVIQGQTATEAYDGKMGWKVNPFAGYGGGKAAEPMTSDELQSAEVEADLDGPLMDYKAKGHTVELLGVESVEGASSYKLKVTLKNGQVQTTYLDAESFLKTKTVIKRKERGKEIEMEMIYGDYKEVGGVLLPHSIEFGAPGSPQRAKVQVDKFELNVPIDDQRFAMPLTPALKNNATKD